ncbi:MAG: glutamate--tRNA ligase family protein [Candidatus Limnocylindrales bacterium]
MSGPTTRFAPAPTGYLHLGHVANAIFVWGLAGAAAGQVILRIEDHDRGRCRPEYEAALLDDLDWLGFRPDRPSTDELRRGPSPFRQSDSEAAYAVALEQLRTAGHVYACECTRATFAAWEEARGTPWSGPGCPGGCRDKRLPDVPEANLRVALGDGDESFVDRIVGARSGDPSARGDLLVRGRDGWTYGFAVVVDDIRHGIDLVVRGEDLLDETPRQIRLGRLLGRSEPALFGHHQLVHRPDGTKLSKAQGDTSIRELRGAGASAEALIGRAAAEVGIEASGRPLAAAEVDQLFR